MTDIDAIEARWRDVLGLSEPSPEYTRWADDMAATVPRLLAALRAAEAELKDMGDRLVAGFEDAMLLAEAVKPFEQRAIVAEAREKALREAGRCFLNAISEAESFGWNWANGNAYLSADEPGWDAASKAQAAHAAFAVALAAEPTVSNALVDPLASRLHQYEHASHLASTGCWAGHPIKARWLLGLLPEPTEAERPRCAKCGTPLHPAEVERGESLCFGNDCLGPTIDAETSAEEQA